MDAAVTKPPAGKSWRRLAFVLAAFVLLPLATSQLQLVIPILETYLLLVPIIAVCAVIGWIGGGKPWLAIAWVSLAAWILIAPLGKSGSPYEAMARGWALLLAGSFGLMSLWSATTPFIVRALGALGVAMGTAFVLAISTPGGIDRYEKVSAAEFSARGTSVLALLHAEGQSPLFRSYASKTPELDDLLEGIEALPALVALESLASLALGWAVYTRLTPNHIGPPLSPLRDFRFSDQLVWGVAVGATMLLLPPFEEGRNAGLNLLVFFGALYFIRGMGVVAWISRRRSILIASVLIFFFVPPLLIFLVAAVVGIGLGDTWLDWRKRPAAA